MSIITDEMVEAGAREIAIAIGEPLHANSPGFLGAARAALAAVAPAIRAAALEEAAKVADVLEGDTEYVYYGRPTIGGSIRALAKERGDE